MGHHHHIPQSRPMLLVAVIATALFVAVEFTAGVLAHSISLISDAGHNAIDALALLLAFAGLVLDARPADEIKTYGYQRAGVLAAFVNALTLVLLSGWIVFESLVRLAHPQPVETGEMMWVAGLGVVLNGGIMLSLFRASAHDLNVRGAFLHMLSDLMSSIAIVVGAFLIRLTGRNEIDSLLSLLIVALIVWTAWDIIKESLNILLEGLPKGLDLNAVVRHLCRIDGVLGVHDMHIWSLGTRSRALSCHVLIDDMPPSASDAILTKINGTLAHDFAIHHTTVQFEHVPCEVDGAGCVSPAESRSAVSHETSQCQGHMH